MKDLKLSNTEKAFIQKLNKDKKVYSFDKIELKDKNNMSRYYDAYWIAQKLLKNNIIKCSGQDAFSWVLNQKY
tara:strand:+ start:887 stop:1105 length:219 start_codon:yes stop_codon:yes gene_type:complete